MTQLIKNKTIVCISPIDWDFLRQRHQILMTKFAQNNNKIIYIENLNPSPDINFFFFHRLFRRFMRIFFPNTKSKNMIPENITVIAPFLVPFKDPFSQFINKQICIRLLSRKIKKCSTDKNPIVWTYQVTALAQKLITYLQPEFIIYDCVFDVLTHPNSPKNINILEKEIISKSRLVTTDNRHLFDRCVKINPNTHLIQPGVDFELFSQARDVQEKAWLKQIKSPRLCFFGGIDKLRIDFELIEYVAEQNPDWNIILIGPVIKTDVSHIKQKNIYFAKTVPYAELSAYLKEMDVLILPYKIIPFSKSILPAKIYECMATGKPIVATPLDELKFLAPDLIRIAEDKESFILKIKEALAYDTKESKVKRVNTASKNSWQNRFDEIQSLIIEHKKS